MGAALAKEYWRANDVQYDMLNNDSTSPWFEAHQIMHTYHARYMFLNVGCQHF